MFTRALQVQIEPLVAKIEGLQARLEQAQTAQHKLAELERQTEILQRDRGALTYDLDAAHEAFTHLQQLHAAAVEAHHASAASEEAGPEISTLREQLTDVQQQVVASEERSKRFQELLTEASKTIARLQQQESGLQSTVQQAAEKEATLLQEVSTLRESLERQRAEHEKAVATLSSLHDRYLSSVNEIQVLNERLRAFTDNSRPGDAPADAKILAEEKERLVQALRGMHQELTVLRAAPSVVQERDRLRDELLRLQASRPAETAAEADQLRNVVKQMTVHLTSAGEQRDAALAKLSQTEGLYADAQRAHNALIAQCQGLQKALEEAHARLAVAPRADTRTGIGGPPELGRSAEHAFSTDHSHFEDPARPSFDHRPATISQFSKVLGSPEQVGLAEELSGMGYKREACIEAARRYTTVGPAVAWLIDGMDTALAG
jgi:DNA repair exonuclease SbcCD ATPase subunit